MARKENGHTDVELVVSGEGSTAVLEAVAEAVSVEPTEDAGRKTARKIRDVMETIDGWQVSSISREPFTNDFTFSALSPVGNVYRIKNQLDMAAAIMNEEDMMLADRAYGDVLDRNDEAARFERSYGYSPSVEQLNNYMANGTPNAV